jgi:hypothetical protein
MKKREFEASGDIVSEAEYADFITVEGEIYPEDEIPVEVIEGLPEGIDEDLLFEEYRDDRFERQRER